MIVLVPFVESLRVSVWFVLFVVVCVKGSILWFSKPNIESLGGLGTMAKYIVTHQLGRVSLRCILVPFESINVSLAPSCSLVDVLCAPL